MTRLAVVHPTTLLGKEILERLTARPELIADLRLLSDVPDEIGTVLDAAGAAAIVAAADDGFDGVDLALFAGAAADVLRAAERLGAGTLAVFAAADGAPAATPAAVAGFATADRLGVARLASAHPAAVALAHLLAPLRALGLSRAHATVVLPVSMQGSAGIDTLFDETRALLTFTEKKKSRLYPAQVAFNLLPASESETAVEQQVAAALGPGCELSVGLAQAGVFHGLAVSVAVELDAGVDQKALERALGAAPLLERPKDPKKVGSAAAAGEANLLLGAARASGAGRFRLWATMDNLVRGAALNSLDLAAELLAAGRPS